MIKKIKKQTKNHTLSSDDFTKTAQAMQDIFGPQSEQIAQSTRFIRRKRKLTASVWIQNAVLTFAKHPNATLENFAESFLDSFGISLSEQAISQRLQQPSTRQFHQQMLEAALQKVLSIPPCVEKVAEVFQEIHLGDCTTLALPQELQETFPGCSNQYSQGKAALKIFCRYELLGGTYHEIAFGAGKTSDQKLYQSAKPLRAGVLELLDLGFFSTKRFENLSSAGIYWISRVSSKTVLTYENQEFSLAGFLKTTKKKRLEVNILLGSDKVPCRLIARRAPPYVVSQRMDRMKKDAKRRNKRLSEDRIFMASWTVFVTNIPQDMVSLQGIGDLYGLRWQVELLFKHWKSEVQLDKTFARGSERILSEIYLKLLCELMTTWIMNLSGGPLQGLSRKKMHKKVREHLWRISGVFEWGDLGGLEEMLKKIHREMRYLRKQKRRKKKPSAFQTLRNIRAKPLT